MKKIALYLVLLLGLGIYAACDGGGDDDGPSCGEPIQYASLTDSSLPITGSITGEIVKNQPTYYKITVDEGGVYTISFQIDDFNAMARIFIHTSDCWDDYKAVTSEVTVGDIPDASNTASTGTYNFTENTTYLLLVSSAANASGPDTSDFSLTFSK